MNAEQEQQLKEKKEKLQSALRVKNHVFQTLAPQWIPVLKELQSKQIDYKVVLLACMQAGDEAAWQEWLATPEIKGLGFSFEQLIYHKPYAVPFTNKLEHIFLDNNPSSRYNPDLPNMPEMENQPLSVVLPAAKQALGFTDEQVYIMNAYETTVIAVAYDVLGQLNLQEYQGLDDWLITNANMDWLIWLGWEGDCRWGWAKK